VPEDNAPRKVTRDPQALSSEYHKARKQLMLWAGLLFIWELVGIDLEKAKEAGGNAGAIITAIKSPQAIPWVMLILVAYLLFKTTVEWYQCSVARRQLRASRVDFTSAWIISIGAYALYLFQAVKKVQVADVVQGSSNTTQSFATGALVTLMIGVVLIRFVELQIKRFREDGNVSLNRFEMVFLTQLIAVPIVGLGTISYFFRRVDWFTFAKGGLVGLAVVLLLGIAKRWVPSVFRNLGFAILRGYYRETVHNPNE
jgi:hypothetical protein